MRTWTIKHFDEDGGVVETRAGLSDLDAALAIRAAMSGDAQPPARASEPRAESADTGELALVA